MPTILQQSFSVPFRYPVAFTEHLFAESQALFADTFPEGQLARVFFVLDSGVVAHHPGLISQIKTYIAATPDDQAHVERNNNTTKLDIIYFIIITK